jgi:hypothetical protein
MRVLFNNPIALYNYIFRSLNFSVEQQFYGLSNNLWKTSSETFIYWSKVQSNLQLNRYVFDKLGGKNYGQMVAPELLYCIVRETRPSVVVETGVSAGISSAYILQAMEDNGHGHLFSIDYPDHSMIEGCFIPKGEKSGFAIPPYLRSRWTLWAGKSQELLKPLLKKVDKIDIFVHDSEHSYENMLFEYVVAWEYIKKHGLLISHDINDNNAFRHFSKSHSKKYKEIYFTGIGVIQK